MKLKELEEALAEIAEATEEELIAKDQNEAVHL